MVDKKRLVARAAFPRRWMFDQLLGDRRSAVAQGFLKQFEHLRAALDLRQLGNIGADPFRQTLSINDVTLAHPGGLQSFLSKTGR